MLPPDQRVWFLTRSEQALHVQVLLSLDWSQVLKLLTPVKYSSFYIRIWASRESVVRQPKAGSTFSWPCVPGELKVMWQMAGRERGIALRVRARQIHQTAFPEMQRDPDWDEQGVCSRFLHP